jgi:hypothetical protein
MPILVFAEGGTTNGTGLLKLKKGAFFAERSIKPIVLKYSLNTSVSPAFDIIELLPLAIL